jgi:glycosyltransferase involved in cell wall biosynthesis
MVTAVRYKYNIDTTVSFLRGPNILNVMAGGKCRKIVSERNDPSCKDEYYRKRALFVNQRADHVVFQTRRVQEMYPEDVRRKSSVIVNPTEVSCMAADVKSKKIVTVGRLHEQKNQKMLLKAFSLYHKSHPDYHLYFYGEGELLQELMQAARNYNLSRCVHFEGFKEDIHEAIADAEQFVLSSDYEGLPNALMEAMMMGLACISTACNGSEVLIDHEQNGLLVPVGDAETLGKAMCRLSDEPRLRDRLGKAAALSAQEWKTERVVRLWERIL